MAFRNGWHQQGILWSAIDCLDAIDINMKAETLQLPP